MEIERHIEMKKELYKANPFFLEDEDIAWVEDTLNQMTLEEKCGQVFCPMGLAADQNTLTHMIEEIGVGAMMYRPGFSDEIWETHKKIQDMAKIPLLLAANTESGGEGLSFSGTSF